MNFTYFEFFFKKKFYFITLKASKTTAVGTGKKKRINKREYTKKYIM
jgi:hypothetical protein